MVTAMVMVSGCSIKFDETGEYETDEYYDLFIEKLKPVYKAILMSAYGLNADEINDSDLHKFKVIENNLNMNKLKEQFKTSEELMIQFSLIK